MLNYIWLALLLVGVLLGGWNDRFQELTEAAFTSAKTAVLNVAIPLIGITALWLGLIRLAEKAGLIATLARGLRPLLKRLFPDVPPEHPAMGSMLLNISANIIGLTNAATPLGLRAMADLEKLNRNPGVATNAMCTFLALNTSSLQLIPATAIGILAASGSKNPAAIVGSTLVATFFAAVTGLVTVKTLEKLPWFRLSAGTPSCSLTPAAEEPVPPPTPVSAAVPAPGTSLWRRLVFGAFLGAFLFMLIRGLFFQDPAVATSTNAMVRALDVVSKLAIPFLLAAFPLHAALSGVAVYEEFVEGAKEGFQVAVRIIPYLVAMLVAVGVFRAAGGVDILTKLLRPVLDWIHFPAELLPMAITRPLSGSATIGLFTDIVRAHGPDSLLSRTAGTIIGSTETTFYVIAVYFGAVGIRKTRHAVVAGLMADLMGALAAVYVCRMMFS
jgi:spore maturation protein SpmA